MSKNNPVKYKDIGGQAVMEGVMTVSYTHLRAHET